MVGNSAAIETLVRDTEQAHAIIGGFLARCSALDFRTGQLIARWFCSGDKQKYLSYVLHSMEFDQKRQVVEERLINYHRAPHELRKAVKEAAPIMERRNLITKGLLSTRPGGRYCIKSFSGARFLTGPGEEDIIDVDTLPAWSQRATELADRLVKLGDQLTSSAA